MPSFWQGFRSHGSLKYCGQLWSSRGPVLSTDRFCWLCCPWSRLLGRAVSREAFLESSEVCCSWPWRTRPWGVSLLVWTWTSVWLRWVISWGNKQRDMRTIQFHSWRKFPGLRLLLLDITFSDTGKWLWIQWIFIISAINLLFFIFIDVYNWLKYYISLKLFNIVIWHFYSYTSHKIIINIDYIPCVVQYTLVIYFIHSSLYLIIPSP